MSYVRQLGPIVPGGDGYETFWTPNCAYAQIQVVNGAIDYSVAHGESTMQATFSVPDDTLLPGSGPILGPLQAIRFKAHTPVSNPAPQVSIRAEKALPLGISLSPAWTPSYATIDATGAIGALFTGHVSARGIDLPSDATGSSKVQWFDADGALVAEIYGEHEGDQSNDLWLHAAEKVVGDKARVNLVAGAIERIALDSDGNSSFVQLGTGLQAVALFGTTNLSWDGTSRLSFPVLNVPHTLGRVPLIVLPDNPNVNYHISAGTYTNAQFTLRGNRIDGTIPAAGFTLNVNWLLIG